MTVAESVSALRRRAGLSQEALAEKLDVSRQTVNLWENGLASPTAENVLAMAELFGVSTDALLKGNIPAEEILSEESGVQAEENIAPLAEEGLVNPAGDLHENQPQYEPRNDAYAPYGEAYRPADFAAEQPAAEPMPPQASQEAENNGMVKKLIAVAVALCLIITAVCLPFGFRYVKSFWWRMNGGEVKYPYVLVHGMGGWGENAGLSDVVPYWGADSCNIADYLRGQGCEVVVPTVGPYSGTWDRACELYAQLTGTQVDYGEAHAKAHNHERFGRSYTVPMVTDWGEKVNGGQRVKVNLVGHSFGGTTVRMLAWLLANGSEAEQAATGKDTSPLFTGGKEDWVFSVTTICTPHNGSQLTEIVDDLGSVAGIQNTTQLLVSTLVKALGSDLLHEDLLLDQFGITDTAQSEKGLAEALMTLQGSGTDNAIYEVSPDGAAELNQSIKTVDSIYYFSYAYSTVKEGGLLGGKTPRLTTMPVLQITALAMAKYTGTTEGGITIDESWQDNDGLVSVASAQFPTGEAHAEFPEKAKDYETGIWYVAPTLEGDHGTAIGLNAGMDKTQSFYGNLTKKIDSLRG